MVKPMYQKPKFLKVLHEIRQQMARECDYDIDLFAQTLRMNPKGPEPGTESVPRPSEINPRRRARKAKKERKV